MAIGSGSIGSTPLGTPTTADIQRYMLYRTAHFKKNMIYCTTYYVYSVNIYSVLVKAKDTNL